MPDATNSIYEYSRSAWSLNDLRSIVNDTAGWPGDSDVYLTAAQPKTPAGTIEVVNAVM